MEQRVILPAAMILDLDDVMWHCGMDLRYIGQASRSEFPRYHVPEDYDIIHRLGQALDMKIICPICIGDWDKENFLRGEVGTTHDPHGWNRKEQIDYDTCRGYFKAAESSEYIEYAYHGLLHGLYDENGKRRNEWEYFDRDENEIPYLLPESEIERHLSLFDKIYESWNFQKKIRSFCPPCGVPLRDKSDWSQLDPLLGVLYRHNVRYVIGRWQGKTEASYIGRGVLFMEKHSRFGVSSAAYDVDPRYIPDFYKEGDTAFGDVLGMHWANFLHYYPQNNLERLGQWVNWFHRQAENFGLMLSRDIAFTGRQCIYRKNSTVTVRENECVIDVSAARALDFDDLGNVLYVSFQNDSLPRSCTGGEMELYEEKKGFKTYRVTAHENVLHFDIAQ